MFVHTTFGDLLIPENAGSTGKNRVRMSTEEPPQASDEVMSLTVEPVEAEPAMNFEDFYRQEYRNMVGLAYVLTGNRWSAEDTAQDALTAAFRKWKVLSTFDAPGAWLRRVTCNRSVSLIRKRVREAKILAMLGGREASEIRLDDDDAAFWQAVRRLPARQAQAVALFYFDDMSVSEIAAVLECSEGTVKTHLSRGREAVAKQLQLEDEHE
jgi:RNA polymerase sigma-70 factor (sigma-E family)